MIADLPGHGLPAAEFERRCERAQAEMRARELDALVVTAAPNVRYFSGFATQFWESPTRPWFVVVPATAPPLAVIPEIGGPGMRATWIGDVRTWPAPRPEDDGVGLLGAALDALPRRFGRIGWELGRESVVRMPLVDFERLREVVRGFSFCDGSPCIWALRRVKSEAEIDRVRAAARIANAGFETLRPALAAGDTERTAATRLRHALLDAGADDAPFVAALSGRGGYAQIIVGPTDRALGAGDVLFIDVGAVYDGYYCDFDRNFAFGDPGDDIRRAQDAVWRATEAGIAAAHPGATASEVWRAMAAVLEAAGSAGLNVGRMGHGLGLQLTEPPSNMPGDDTALEPGTVLTIEPGMTLPDGRMIVHEENLVVRDGEAELLSLRAPREMWRVDA